MQKSGAMGFRQARGHDTSYFARYCLFITTFHHCLRPYTFSIRNNFQFSCNDCKFSFRNFKYRSAQWSPNVVINKEKERKCFEMFWKFFKESCSGDFKQGNLSGLSGFHIFLTFSQDFHKIFFLHLFSPLGIQVCVGIY